MPDRAVPPPLSRRLLALLAPPRCLCCRTALGPGEEGGPLCRRCGTEIAMSAPVRLRGDAIDGGFAALPYRGAGRRLVAALKFARLRAAAGLGAELISTRAPAGLIAAAALVPVPPAPLRVVRRGIDPTLELALALGDAAGLPVQTPLRRHDVRHQRGRTRGERLARPPSIAATGAVAAGVVLVDDVVTTGATIDACAGALRRAGAVRVSALALAAADPRRRLPRARGRT